MKSLLLATTNPGKITEIKHALSSCGWKILIPSQIGLVAFDVPETGNTFRSNAILKVKAFAHKSGLVSLAEDTGLIVKALGGRPGVFSRRYGASEIDRNKRVLKELAGKTDRTAYFECVAAIYDPTSHKLAVCRGKTHGKILKHPIAKIKPGLGYDSIFFSLELNKSFAQATVAEKNRVSHRGRALAKATKILKQLTRQ